MERMLKNDLLLPYQKDIGDAAQHFGNISPFIREQIKAFNTPEIDAGDYVVPYMWGTSGILYNTHYKTADEVSTWACLWDTGNKGKILMKDSYWDAYNVAVIYGFYDQIASGRRTIYQVANDHTPQDIEMAEQQLKALKPNLAGWEADFGKEMMTKGEIWLSYAWSGDAVWAIDEAQSVNVTLDYVVPEEGSNVWFDGWVIPKYARNQKAASYFLSFLCQSEAALRNMDVSGFTSAIGTPEIAEAMADSTLEKTVNLSYFFGPGHDSLKLNHIQYPDRSIVDRCATINDFLDKNDTVLEMWSRAKGDSLNKGMAVAILLFLAVVSSWLIVSRLKKFFGKQRRFAKLKTSSS
ncbi:MAG: extracellular solute-binding protein [Breznakibacter sp.]